jgi:uncharacterized protein
MVFPSPRGGKQQQVVSLLRVFFLLTACIALLVFLNAPSAAEKWQNLRPHDYVNDFAHVLSSQTVNEIDALCSQIYHKAQAQIAVVTVQSLDGDTIEDFSVQLATQWGVGGKSNDRGVLILLAIQDRQYRIEVGYGLEGILPDGKVGDIGREVVPQLRKSDYNAALLVATLRVAQIIARDRNVTLAADPSTLARFKERPAQNLHFNPVLLFFGGMIGLMVLSTLISALRGRGIARTGVLPWWWMGGGPWGGGFGGGGGFSGGFGGGGGGGFGGFGGGSFGGGGASGSW